MDRESMDATRNIAFCIATVALRDTVTIKQSSCFIQVVCGMFDLEHRLSFKNKTHVLIP